MTTLPGTPTEADTTVPIDPPRSPSMASVEVPGEKSDEKEVDFVLVYKNKKSEDETGRFV